MLELEGNSVELNVKILQDTKEIVVELLDENYDLKIFQDLELAVSYIKQLLIKALDGKEQHLACQEEPRKDCIVRTWYIRYPLERILNLLKYAASTNCTDARKVLEDYFTIAGLSKSNVRVIYPTLSALQLQVGNRLTNEAIQIGKLLAENKLDKAADLLFQQALKNCVLKEIIESILSTDTNAFSEYVKKVLEKKSNNVRRDELVYTVELLRFLYRNSPKCRCYIIKNIFTQYLYNKQKIYVNNVPQECLLDIIELLLRYIKENKPYILQNILDPVNARIDRIELIKKGDTMIVVDKHADACMQVVPKLMITRDVLYASSLRQELDKMRKDLAQKRTGKLTYIIAVLILVNDVHTKAKLYLEHLLRDQVISTKIIDLP